MSFPTNPHLFDEDDEVNYGETHTHDPTEDEMQILREMEDVAFASRGEDDIFTSKADLPPRRFTSMIIRESLREASSTPSSPVHLSSPTRTRTHRRPYEFSSSPPGFTSPLSRAAQPTPVPSDFRIIGERQALACFSSAGDIDETAANLLSFSDPEDVEDSNSPLQSVPSTLSGGRPSDILVTSQLAMKRPLDDDETEVRRRPLRAPKSNEERYLEFEDQLFRDCLGTTARRAAAAKDVIREQRLLSMDRNPFASQSSLYDADNWDLSMDIFRKEKTPVREVLRGEDTVASALARPVSPNLFDDDDSSDDELRKLPMKLSDNSQKLNAAEKRREISSYELAEEELDYPEDEIAAEENLQSAHQPKRARQVGPSEPQLPSQQAKPPNRLSISEKAANERAKLDALAKEFRLNALIRKAANEGSKQHISRSRKGTSSRFNFSQMPSDGRRWTTAFNPDTGVKLYFPLKARNNGQQTGGTKTNSYQDGGLLSMDIHEMIRNIEREKKRNEAAEAAGKSIAMEDYAKKPAIYSAEVTPNKSETMGQKLWVDKYAPRKYIDLVGEERIFREVLQWLQEWNYCVFRKLPRKRSEIQNMRKKEKPADKLRRPERRILLLSGPAGLGKTTLAHVVGGHCGYNIVEINASDDRGGLLLKDKILSAVETQTSIAKKKPNLVIVDEIDGASQAGGENNLIKLLVDLATAEWSPKSANLSKKQRGTKRTLLRPIICICNDIYAPVLRPLRMVAQVYTFRSPPHRILATRLSEVCKWEGLNTDLRTLMALCDLTDGDVRSSLNTLQFIRQKTRILTHSMLSTMDIGHKDMARGLFTLWDKIFSVPTAKERKSISLTSRDSSAREESTLYDRLLSSVVAAGDIDKVLQGCFENYLSMRFVDVGQQTGGGGQTKLEQIADWLVFHDVVDSLVNHRGLYELAKYQSYTILNFHRLFATSSRPQLKFPKADYEAFVARTAKQGIVLNFISGLSPSEIPSWANRNRVLLKPAERDTLNRVVSIMISMGLRFISQKGLDGNPQLVVEAPLHELQLNWRVGDSTEQVTRRRSLNAAVGHLVHVEIEKELIRRSERQTNPASKSLKGGARPSTYQPESGKEKKGESVARSQQPSLTTLGSAMAKSKKVAKDFFGRPLGQPDTHSTQRVALAPKDDNAGVEGKDTVKVVFRYSEGFSNAVRKPLKIRDFL
ncbi:hypothetical protein DFJ73DRAFT_523020 [Zopfochytrium polystomum]|nr:hypothetical protein DFJ73DRAFT_523020 [Zopfochytrium polystomum]